MNWAEQYTEHAWRIKQVSTLFLFLFIWQNDVTRIFTNFWVLNKLVRAGMLLQSLSSKQVPPSQFTCSWPYSELEQLSEDKPSNCLGIQDCLVVRVQMMGLYLERNGMYSEMSVLGCLHTYLPFWTKREGWKEAIRTERKPTCVDISWLSLGVSNNTSDYHFIIPFKGLQKPRGNESSCTEKKWLTNLE